MRILLTLMAFFVFGNVASATEKQKILYVSGTHANTAKISVIRNYLEKHDISIDLANARDFKTGEDALARFDGYDLVFMDDSSARSTKMTFSKFLPAISRAKSRLLAINWLQSPDLVKGLTSEQAQVLHDYYDNGGMVNLSRMADYLAYQVLGNGTKTVPAPVVYPEVGIYAPGYDGLIFEDVDSYLNWRGQKLDTGRPVIGVLLQRSLIESVNTTVVDDAIARIEEKGALAIPFFFELSPRSSDYTPMLQKDGKTIIDVIVNFRAIHWANKRKEEFEKLGVPVLQALTYFDGDQAAWEQDSQGISSTMTPFVLVLPETAGVIDPVIVAAVNQESGHAEVIDYQMDHLVSRALKYAALRHKPNGEKKLTVMVWGDKDMGASFLNIEHSLRSISANLNEAGYGVDKVDSNYFTDPIDRILNPFYRDYELDGLLKDDLAELMPVKEYLKWFNSLPEDVTKPINDFWGQAEDNFMVVKRDGEAYFVLPRIRNGNMLIMRQPPRSDDKDQDKMIYHQGTVPMNHYYLAAYYYARKFWNSDAIIHLGTHGSQEYLNGKERGLSRYDQGNLAVWDTPVMYPFIIDDVGEAMQTKRRGSAVVVAHMTPPFAAAGLEGVTANVHELMHQYRSMDEGGVKVKTGEELKKICFESKVCDDLAMTSEQIDADFDHFLEELHLYLEDVANANQPLGLHTFGELAEPDLVTSTIVQMLGRDFIARAREFEADHYGVSPEAGNDHLDSKAYSLEDLAGFKTVRDYVIKGRDFSGLEDELRADLEKARDFYNRMEGIRELPHLLAGLSGQYVPVKTGGDPVRSPDSLASGFNLYGFDPSHLPTKAAWEQGKELVEGVIGDYYKEHGNYPDKLAFSLWSIEAMRHYGVLESQALYAMGVRPVWSESGMVTGTEIIPMRELKRPRVDVVLSATGLYRDAFPNVVLLLAEAVKKVAELKEANNSIWENSQRVKAELLAEGMSEEDAEYFSTVRVFSNESGTYGSGVDDAVRASDTWETDAKIADNYMAKMGNAYGADPNRWGEKVEGVNIYGKQLSGTDVAMFARSSNLYGMISSDDPFEYFGGLSLAIRNLDGKSPQMVISNLRDANNPRAEEAAQFLAKELRTRTQHSRWVSEMMKEGYSGATTMEGKITNFWGWQVVDPNLVRADQWQEFAEIYVNDKFNLGISEWFEKVNPGAQAQIIERMLEAMRKDYWDASDETRKQLVERLIELVNKYDLIVDNEKLADFVNAQAAGFGMSAALPAPDAATQGQMSQPVQGRELQKVEQAEVIESGWDLNLLGSLALCFIFFAVGAMRQTIGPFRNQAV
ncbi:cobaltochelatase subunit CobN [Luteithermobacter gelatinilyticus]|uniref:cobaltochelatase subunit CobN n=1 Tax=Luteithermobacter gelatinilyticus TaxID=2582913 RepID=UPI001105B983|nr:cobaltochelatase subunit CobN [Luteithermobacter gelatinilyticus]